MASQTAPEVDLITRRVEFHLGLAKQWEAAAAGWRRNSHLVHDERERRALECESLAADEVKIAEKWVERA